MLASLGLCAFLSISTAATGTESCQATLIQINGNFITCLHDSAARSLRTDAAYAALIQACELQFNNAYAQAMRRWNQACPGYEEFLAADAQSDLSSATASGEGIRSAAATEGAGQGQSDQLKNVGHQAVSSSSLLISGTTPTPPNDSVVFFNNCALELKLMSNQGMVNGVVLKKNGGTHSVDLSSLNQAGPNTIYVAPITSSAQCSTIDCSNWTAIQAAGQREGSMWEAPNLTYAAYCQATNAAVSQCIDDKQNPSNNINTPCCGPNMNLDRTFGTLFEITPNAGGQDYVDISTNYGSGPSSPPDLCGPGVDPNNCVSANANIFFNVPIDIAMGQECSCGSLGLRKELTCTEVSCTDAYQYPMDTKQCACDATVTRGYTVTYCPEKNNVKYPLPTIGNN
ncbi:hypothetical protein CCR91_14695 [Thiorhodovibrio winogradskyi]|nr:hypothetical protein [Thiorhodovibrio winogradskyi]